MFDTDKLCGSNSSLNVLEDNHVGHCFLQLCLICPIHAILAAINIFYLVHHQRNTTRAYHVSPKLIKLNIFLCGGVVFIIIAQIAFSAFGLQTVHPPLYFLYLSFIAFSWFLSFIHFFQQRQPPTLLCILLILSLGTTVTQLSSLVIRVGRESMNSAGYRIENYGVVIRLFLQTIVVIIVLILRVKWLSGLNSQTHTRLHFGIQAEQASETDRLFTSEDYHVYYSGLSHGETSQDLTTVDENSNCFSRLTFWWVYQLMKKGLRGNIKVPEDVFFLPQSLDTKGIGETFQGILQSIQKDVFDRQRFLLKALHKSFGVRYYSVGILKFLGDVLGFAGPLLLHALVSFMENRNEPIEHGYYYAAGLFISTLIGSFLSSHYGYQVNKVGLQIRAAVITAVYHKTLAVKSTDLHSFSTGEVVNFMSTDTDRIVNFCASFHQFWSLPFQIAVSLYLLHQQVGLSFLAGLCFAVLLIPVNKWLAVKIRKYSEDMMKKKDSRVKVMNEILYGIRVIKFYAWEKMFSAKVDNLRDGELKSLKGMKYLDAWCVYFWATTPVLISILTFCTYVLLGNTLTAAKVFTSIALFNMLIFPLNVFPWVINGLIEAWVSLNRVNKFLVFEDLDLEEYYSGSIGVKDSNDDFEAMILMANGHFTWNTGLQGSANLGENEDGTGHDRIAGNQTDKQADVGGENSAVQRTQYLQDVNLSIEKGKFIGIVGKVGSGKSSLLSAITAEMDKTEGKIYVADLAHGFGMASQEPWIQHATVKENILFGKPFEYNKYRAVIKACALEEDLKILPAHDQTEVGENGVTLSGGQKSRIALARAVYQDKEIYLLDDPLAAVDTHVAAHIFTHCIVGILKNKTRILCTHHRKYLQDADVIIVVDQGRIMCVGPPQVILNKDVIMKHISNIDEKNEDNHLNEESVEEKDIPLDSGLVEEEEKDVGVVKFHVYRSYGQAAGTCLAGCILLSMFLMQSSRNISDWWLSYWISHDKSTPSHNTSSISSLYYTSLATASSYASVDLHVKKGTLTFYLVVYGGIAAANSIFTLFRAFLFAYGGVKAAQVVHQKLLNSILQAPISFFDITPIGRIVNRFSSDTYSIDDSLPFMMNIFMAQLFGVGGTIVITCYGLPWFTLVLFPLAFLYYKIQNYYRKTSREVKRLMTVSLSPVYAHFSETLSGLPTIRALRDTPRFLLDNERKLELNQRANFSGLAASQWLGLQLQMLGVVMVTCVSFIAVLEHHFSSVNPGLVGLAISYALTITSQLSGLVTSFTETEKQMVSVERAMQYVDGVPKEDNGPEIPPLLWPSHGRISFDKAVLIYRPGLAPALHGISFETLPAEKIGIVGRTGSGKSSLFLVLFKIVSLSSGVVTIDGVDISSLNLQRLRSALSIIPQDPFLFSDSVRKNLDPTDQFNDQQLWEVLERCHLKDAVKRLGGLLSDVGERGRNLSCGQRQLICLARALLKRTKVLCIDEATASVDFETDQLIQKTIREEFQTSTVLTIAHRIETILDSDRVLVLGKGRVAEFGPPAELRNDDRSLFSKLVEND